MGKTTIASRTRERMAREVREEAESGDGEIPGKEERQMWTMGVNAMRTMHKFGK